MRYSFHWTLYHASALLSTTKKTKANGYAIVMHKYKVYSLCVRVFSYFPQAFEIAACTAEAPIVPPAPIPAAIIGIRNGAMPPV